MANPYVAPSIASYNENPPPDDGTQVPENEAAWADVKTKLADPVKTLAEADIAATTTAFGKVTGGIQSTSISYTVLAADQGKTIVATTAGITITTPDAAGTGIGAGFKFGVINTSNGDITIDGSGAQTIDGETTVTLPSLRGVDLDTNGSNWFSKGQNWEAVGFAIPTGRLTLTTAVPVLTSDVTAAATVYYTPYTGNTIKLWNGTKFFSVTFSEVSQALSDNTKSPAAATTDSLYDMFGWLDGTTFRVTRGPAWTSATGRGTGAGTTELERVQGVLMNKVAISNGPAANRGIYLGTIATNGSTQMAMMFAPSAAAGGTANRLDVWNMYNRRRVLSTSRDSTNSWDYTTATVRSANNSTSNRITYVCGVAEDFIEAYYLVPKSNTQGSVDALAGIGVDATNAFSGFPGTDHVVQTSGKKQNVEGKYAGIPGLGRHFVQACEYSEAAGTTTWYGDNNAPTLTQMALVYDGWH